MAPTLAHLRAAVNQQVTSCYMFEVKPHLLAAGAAALIAGGAYLYQASRTTPGAAPPPRPTPTTPAQGRTDALTGRSPQAPPAAVRQAPAELAQRQRAVGSGVTTITAPASEAKVAPYPHVDLRKAGGLVPGLDDLESDRTQLGHAPASPLAQELSEARAAFRAGDLARAHALARKLSAAEPANTAARRLAVSTACKLGDKDYVASAWPDLTGNEQAALTRYCGTTTIDLPGLGK
ncbi:MAG: hypothetical protein R3B06_15900 [Kofleriaceae bacterium]